VNYGSKSTSTTIRVITAGGDDSENCVIEDCVVDWHPTSHVGMAIMFSFETSSGFHRFCAIRNCAGRGQEAFEQPPDISTKDFAAIAPGVGLGTVIEGNQIANVCYGIYGNAQPAKDIVVWNNIFRNVQKGITWDQGSGAAVGRFVVSDNTVDLSRLLTAPIGFEFIGTSNDQYGDLVLRKNIVRQVPDTAHSRRTDSCGIRISRATRLIAENNLINDITATDTYKAIEFSNCGSFKFFNNQDSAGQLIRGHDGSKFIQELEDAVQDVLLPV
jgi:hypothetical protein